MDLEELYAPNHIERLKARSFSRSIAFFDDFSASFEYRDLFSVLENIAQFDYEKKPYKDDLYFLCKFVEPALKAIFSNLNTNICRKHLKMPLEKAREFDAKCVLYLAKRPGRSLKEKLCDNKVLSVKRYVNVNTHENRFLKRFIKELLRIIHLREIEFQQVFEELIFSIKSFLKSEVAQQIDEEQAIIPNNLLHFHKHYKRIFKAHDWLYDDVGSLMNLDQIFYLECLYQTQFYTSIKITDIEATLIRNERDLYELIKKIFQIKDLSLKDLSFEKMRLKAKEFLENKLKLDIDLDQEIPQLELCKGVYKEMYIDMFSPKPFALLVGNDNEEKILELPLLAKKQENNIYINANGAKGKIDEKGYLANALKDYDETLVEAFMRDFKERHKIEKLYYLLDDNIKNFEFAKIKHKISLYFKDAKFYPKSVALGLSFLFENKLKKNWRWRYNGVDLVVKENNKNKTFNNCGLVLERQKSDNSKKASILKDSDFIKKALENFKRALELEKEGFILYKECLPKLSMEVIKDGRFKNFEIIKDKTILGDKETLEIETSFIIPKGLESLALPLILNEEKIAYQGKIISKDFPLENDEEYKLTLTYDTSTEFNYVLEFKPSNNDLKPIVIEWQRIDTNGVELPTPNPIKKPSINELKNDFNPKKGKSSDLFAWVLEPLEKKLECGEIKIRKDKDGEHLYYIVKTNDKEVFCHSSQCEESVRDKLSKGVQVCLEVWPNKKDPNKYRGKIYGLEEDKKNVLSKHIIEALKTIKYPCLKIFSHYTLEELETPNLEFTTPFKEYLKRLEEYYFDPQTDKDFKKEILDFFSRLNDSIPEKLQQEFIKLSKLPYTDFLLSRCLGSLEKDFQKKILKNLVKVTDLKTLRIVAMASWNNEKFLKNFMAQTSLEQQKGFLKYIEECLKNSEKNSEKNPESVYFSSACELLLAFLSYRNAKRELELIPESERTMRLLNSIDKAIEKETKIKSFVKLEIKNQRFNNIQPLLLALRLHLRGDLEDFGIEIKGIEENE